MKKPITLLILLFTLCLGQMWGTQYLYMVPNSNWKNGSAWFAAYFWDDSGNAWASMTKINDDLYRCEIPSSHNTNVKFVRKNPANMTLATWDNKWDESAEKTVSGNESKKFNVAGWSGEGDWGDKVIMYPKNKPIYLKVNGDWKSGNPRFAVCFLNGDNHWVDMTQVGSTDYYTCTIPDLDLIEIAVFCRMNAATAENNWDNIWNQTNDLFCAFDKNLCTITGWSNSQSWGQYAPNGAIHGSMNSWVMMSFNPFNGNGELTLELGANTAYEFQVISDESWYGYGDAYYKHTLVGQTAETTLSTGGKDILILTADAGEYTFNWDKSSHELSVTYPNLPNSTNLNPNYVYVKNTSDWSPVNAHLWGGTNATVWENDPALRSINFNSTTYYYAATGYESSIIFGQGVNDSYKTGDLTISEGKGKYYDPSTTSWKWFSSRITLNNQSATSAGTEYKDAELFNTALTTKISCPEKTGYIFGGYYTASDGGGVQIIEDDGDWIASVSGYTNSSTQWVRANTELFAKWTPKTTTVTLKANGGSADGAVVATYDAALPSFVAITRSQHVLTGYWTSATGGTKVINADGSFAANSGTWNREDGETLELFAQWWGLTTPTVTPETTNWAGSDIDITLTATSTYLAEPVVVFYVNDGTNTYEVMGAPYGSDGNSLGTIGAAGSNYSTVHKATFTATTYGTYTVTAKLFEGKFIDNFEADGSVYWSSLGYGACERISNVETEGNNGSKTVLQITRSTTTGELGPEHTAWTTTTAEGGTKTDWNYSYSYIHMRYYAPQTETPKVQYWDNEETYQNTTLNSVSAETWHKLAFVVNGGEVDLIHPFVTSADGNSIYIDDVVLSNEETMTAKVTTTSASTTIYSLSSVTVDPTSSADYFDTPINISLSATSTGLENSVVVFLVNDGTTTFEVVGTPGTPDGSPSYSTTHTATFTTTTPGDYTVTAKLYEGKLIDNFDGSMAHWKAMGEGTFNVSAANPAQQAVNGSSTVMQITRGDADWKTVQTCTTDDGNPATTWNQDYGYIYISMYSTTARTPKIKYSDDSPGYEKELDANSLSANTWQRKQFATTHDIDYILPFMPAEGTMYIDDIILSNESSMTAKATSLGDATAFRVNDNKYYFTGNNKSSTAWNTAANWNRGEVPSSTSEVFILAPVEIATGTTVHVDKVNIVTGGSIMPPNGSSMTASGHLTIAPNAGLNVTGKIRKIADGAYPNNRIATTPADLILESSSAGNASLVFDNDANQATVQMYSKASISGDTWNWQYVGTPFTGSIPLYNYYGSWMYKWNSGWEVVHGNDELTPFAGYCLTQESATTHVMGGTLVPTTSKEVTMAANTDMVLANSWTAPIYIGAFTTGVGGTFTSTPANIYLYNTGMATKESGGASEYVSGEEAGTYVTVPVAAAKYTGDSLIAPMQGFFVTTNSGSAGTITMNYDALVRPAGNRDIIAGPMHAPKRAEERPAVLKMWANGTEYNDRVVILERADFSEGFDNGWDGEKMSFGVASPSVYVINAQGGYDAVSAIPDLEGTVVGFRAGTNNSCTMTFEYDGEEIWYLNDLQTQQSTLIDSELTYTFSTSSYDNEARFIISATPIRKITTGNESVGAEAAKVRKLIINDKLYIIRGGRMYSVDGAMIK